MFDVALNVFVIHFTTNETLRVEDGISRVGMESIFGAVSDTRHVCENEWSCLNQDLQSFFFIE